MGGKTKHLPNSSLPRKEREWLLSGLVDTTELRIQFEQRWERRMKVRNGSHWMTSILYTLNYRHPRSHATTGSFLRLGHGSCTYDRPPCSQSVTEAILILFRPRHTGGKKGRTWQPRHARPAAQVANRMPQCTTSSPPHPLHTTRTPHYHLEHSLTLPLPLSQATGSPSSSVPTKRPPRPCDS